MNHKQEHTLQQIFRHPINSNLKWPEVHSLFHSIGTVTVETEDRFKVEIEDHHQVFHPHHHSDLSADDVIKIRHFLEQTGHVPPDHSKKKSVESIDQPTQTGELLSEENERVLAPEEVS